MSTWAKPGVKCVCVDSRWVSEISPLVEGRVYEIEDVCRDSGWNHYSVGPAVCVVLRGVANPTASDGLHTFHVQRFRPIVTRTQSEDVALFRKLLVPEGADA